MNVIEHLRQAVILPLNLGGLDLSITGGVLTLWLSALLVIFFYSAVARRLQIIPGKLQNVAELLINFIHDELASQIGPESGQWLPFLIGLFTFILFNNLLGLIPGIPGSTININVTATLAILVFLIVQGAGLKKHGLVGYLKSLLPPGVPFFVTLFMIPVELISQLAKPFSLALRLFANMFAGHAVMLLIISLIFVFKSYLILPLPVIGNAAVLLFEIFIAAIQAFVFTYLTSLYIATALEGH